MHMSKLLGGAWLHRKTTRERTWKALSTAVAITTIVNVSALGLLVRPHAALAAPASVWTTQATCANPADQDANEYANGDHVYVRGKNFDANTNYFGQIHGQPGSASADPGELVKEFSTVTDGAGYFCVDAYVVGSDGDLDDGVYTVDIWDNADHQGGSKNDNYHVNALVGSLTINKIVDSGSASADDFSFTISPDPYGVSPVHTSSGSYTFGNLPVGNYSISEASMNNYHQVSNTCSNVAVVNGQQANCTIHNARDTGNITIIKNVVGGTAQPSDWNFTLHPTQGGSDVTGIKSGVSVSVPTGFYTVSESAMAGYSFGGVSGDCSEDGSIYMDVTTNGATCTFTNIADLVPVTTIGLDKTGPATALAGGQISYSLAWSVGGNTSATNAVISDPLPTNTSFVSADNGGTFSAGTVTWNLGTKNPGDSGTVTVTVKIASPLANGTFLSNSACFDTDQTDPVCDGVRTQVNSAPSLSITKTNTSGSFVNPGATVTYTIVVTNAASATDTAMNVNLTDLLPTGFTYTLGGGSTKTFALGNIAPGASVTTTYTVVVSAAEAAGTFTNTAKAKGDNTSEVTATSDVTVHVPQVLGISSPSISITKSANPTSTNPGKTVTYTVVVTNSGSGDATNVVVTDTLPAGFTYTVGGGSTQTWNLGTIKAGTSQTIVYQVHVGNSVKAGTYKNTAVVSADGVDPASASANVQIKVPQVLGLATTGIGFRDYAIFAFGSLLMALGFVSLRRRQPQAA